MNDKPTFETLAARARDAADDAERTAAYRDLAKLHAATAALRSDPKINDARATLSGLAEAAHDAPDKAKTAFEALDPAVLESLLAEPPEPLPGETWEPKDPPPRKWIITGMLPAHRLAALYGTGAAGKSMMALQWAAAIMHGGAPLKQQRDGDARAKLESEHATLRPLDESAQGRVLWLTWEDETAEVIRRWRMAHHAGAIAEPFPDPEKLTLVDMRKLGGALWAPGEGAHVSTRATWTPAGERFLKTMAGHRLAVIDPLAAAFASSEIDRALVRAFTSAIDGHAEASECAVLLIAHPSQSGAAKDGGGYSGSTDWQASVRAHLVLETSSQTAHTAPNPGAQSGAKEEPAKAYRIKSAKQSYAPADGHLWLVRHWLRGDDKKPPELAWFGAPASEAARAYENGEAARAGRPVRSISRKDEGGGNRGGFNPMTATYPGARS